ncbi:phospho-sugar mutase [Natronosporangium hydrolyticum]|uniref:Phospho-sugar mutase n=1 Tax=Natronosporangium hydrolyticum TaxID=2811111 RepID=A0A895YIY1_9ACTN|nr:phospho-sugar mutase [Natronosporangium hydrolyticum]QSB15489.1 phospho-sugar mutase [Natronosporangium hydrolyticum]
MRSGAPDPSLLDQVRAWIDDDPDPADRAELTDLLRRWPDTAVELADRFAGPLQFGTAGLRGPLRAGPNGMNLAVVRGAAAGLNRWLDRHGAAGPIVIGYDARHGSRRFAEETARVATGQGRPATLLPQPLPTPVLAYAVRATGAAAGVMVTASHNPPGDNGYKVYLGEQLGGADGAGAQIAPPADAEIEAAIRSVGPLTEVPLGPAGAVAGTELVEAYVAAAATLVDPTTPRALRIAYTPLHGVGARVFTEVLTRAGFPAPELVPSQTEPDPDFPTVAFPNPEEPGALDALLATAARAAADLAIAHDPDADRCAVAIPAPAGDGWRMLTGDELGILLADQLLRRGAPGRYATTIVSSSLLRALCAARGVPHTETLTGFKWIVRAGVDLAYGYEEALGYCVAPQLVRDKDGITAGLLACELAATLRAEGRSLTDRLIELAAEFGVYVTGQVSLRRANLAEVDEVMAGLRQAPPTTLLNEPVATVTDRWPDADVLTLHTERARLVLRPSGTEPKLKAYLEVVAPAPEPAGVADAQTAARTALAALHDEVTDLLAPGA